MTRSKRLRAAARSATVRIVKTIRPENLQPNEKRAASVKFANAPRVSDGRSVQLAVVPPPPRRSKRIAQRNAKRNPLGRLVDSVLNPFDAIPPPISAGTMFPLAQRRAFLRTMQAIPSGTNTVYIMYLVPSVNSSAISGDGGVHQYMAANTGAAQVANSDFYFANRIPIGNQLSTARVVSGGLSVQVKEALANIPATVYAGMSYSTLSTLISKYPSDLINLPGTTLIRSDTSLLGAFSTYHMGSYSDFDLLSGTVTGWSMGSTLPIPFVIVVTPASTPINLEVNAILHIEGSAGADADNGDELAEDTVEAVEGSIEQVAKAVTRLDAPISGSLNEIVHAAIDTAVARHARVARNFSLRAEGGLVGFKQAVLPPTSNETPVLSHADFVQVPPPTPMVQLRRF